MFRRILIRLVLPAVLGIPAGFLALGLALQHELPSPLLYLFAPGVVVASHVVPPSQTFLGPAIGQVLEVSISVNCTFYFAVFALVAYLVDRRPSK